MKEPFNNDTCLINLPQPAPVDSALPYADRFMESDKLFMTQQTVEKRKRKKNYSNKWNFE